MNRTSSRYLYSVMLILFLFLGTIGIAYGQWTDSIIINGSVSTGELDVDWIDRFCANENPLSPATIRTELIDENDTIKVIVKNGYPGYVGRCQADSEVFSTIPVYIKDIAFNPGVNLTNCSYSEYESDTGSFTTVCDQLWVQWTNGLGKSFDVGSGEGSNLKFEILDGAQQSTDYGFTITYVYEQDIP